MVNKYFEWMHHIQHGIYPGGEELLSKGPGQILFYGLYYTMTGLHGLHVIIGAIVIGTMTRFTIKGVITPDNYVKLEAAGLILAPCRYYLDFPFPIILSYYLRFLTNGKTNRASTR